MSVLRTLSLLLLGCCFTLGCTEEAAPPADDTGAAHEAGSGAGSGAAEHGDEAAGSESK